MSANEIAEIEAFVQKTKPGPLKCCYCSSADAFTFESTTVHVDDFGIRAVHGGWHCLWCDWWKPVKAVRED